MNNIILIGMPACGKSTFGKRLSIEQKKPFVDTDNIIEQIARQAIQKIVDVRGQHGLLKVEQQAILSLNQKNTVIATGGSVIYLPAAMRYLQSLGTIVYLKVSPTEIVRRVKRAPLRGLAKAQNQTISQLYCQRYKLYEKWADVTLENTAAMTDMKFEQLLNQLNLACGE